MMVEMHKMEDVTAFVSRMRVPGGWLYVNFSIKAQTFVPDVVEVTTGDPETKPASARDIAQESRDWPKIEGMTPWRSWCEGDYLVAEFVQWFICVGEAGWFVGNDGRKLASGPEPWGDGARMAVGWLAKRLGVKREEKD